MMQNGTLQHDFIVVLRARSSARFKPEEGQEIFLSGLPGIVGTVRMRLRTRWVDEGFETPTPRELWIEALGPAPTLDEAIAKFSAAGRLLATLLAFCANTSVETPEVHIAYDASPGRTERAFLEVFLPDERGHPREGRLARTAEFSELFTKLHSSSESARISRALEHYQLALRYWYFGGEWLALSHLYMAVEALTKAVLRTECSRQGIDELTLARLNGIETEDHKCPGCAKRSRWAYVRRAWRREPINCPRCLKRSRWREALSSWSRETLIFEGNSEVYQAAKKASDGVEHGFMELSEVHKKAMLYTDSTFKYVRNTIFRLLDISGTDFPELIARVPRDVQSFRKMVRGHFVGDGGDPAHQGDEYPLLEWHSSVKTITRDGDNFTLSFQEKFTVKCAPTYGFRGTSIEVRGRSEPGHEPIRLNPDVQVSVEPKSDAVLSDALSLMTRATRFAADTANPGRTEGMSQIRTVAFGFLAEQTALFEAIEVLLRADRPVEALILLNSLLVGTSRLEALLHDGSYNAGAAIRVKWDAIDRVTSLDPDDTQFAQHLERAKESHRRLAAEQGITIPETAPGIEGTPFFHKHEKMLRFTEEAARADELVVAMHTKKNDEGNVEIHTKVVEPKLSGAVAGMSVLALTASTKAFATAMGWPYDQAIASELEHDGTRLTEESS